MSDDRQPEDQGRAQALLNEDLVQQVASGIKAQRAEFVLGNGERISRLLGLDSEAAKERAGRIFDEQANSTVAGLLRKGEAERIEENERGR